MLDGSIAKLVNISPFSFDSYTMETLWCPQPAAGRLRNRLIKVWLSMFGNHQRAPPDLFITRLSNALRPSVLFIELRRQIDQRCWISQWTLSAWIWLDVADRWVLVKSVGLEFLCDQSLVHGFRSMGLGLWVYDSSLWSWVYENRMSNL